MDRKRYFAGKIKQGTPKFKRCVRLYGPLPEKTVETPVEEVVEAVEVVIEAVEEVEKPKKAKKTIRKTVKKKTEE